MKSTCLTPAALFNQPNSGSTPESGAAGPLAAAHLRNKAPSSRVKNRKWRKGTKPEKPTLSHGKVVCYVLFFFFFWFILFGVFFFCGFCLFPTRINALKKERRVRKGEKGQHNGTKVAPKLRLQRRRVCSEQKKQTIMCRASYLYNYIERSHNSLVPFFPPSFINCYYSVDKRKTVYNQ